MMDYQEALEKHKKDCRRCRERICEYNSKYFSCLQHTDMQAYEELMQYKQLGTLEEVRDAVEKQKANKPEKKRNVFTRGVESHSYYCPYCKFRFINKDDTGFYSGMRTKFCPDCGQAINWNEENVR